MQNKMLSHYWRCLWYVEDDEFEVHYTKTFHGMEILDSLRKTQW